MRRRPEGGIRLRRNADMKLDRAFALVMCGLGMAACSSMPGLDSLKPKPTATVPLIQSNPASAEARSSLGGTCRAPCGCSRRVRKHPIEDRLALEVHKSELSPRLETNIEIGASLTEATMDANLHHGGQKTVSAEAGPTANGAADPACRTA
jgi:hypothetical protein